MRKSITHFKSSRGARHSRKLSAVLQLLLVALMLIPGSARAEGEDTGTGSEEVTFTYISANPEGYSASEGADKLFDGDTGTKWCFNFSNTSYVIFRASKPGMVKGYTITTGNDSGNWGCTGRNPKSWTLYGSNDQQNWTVIDQVSGDSKLEDKNITAYDYTCFTSDVYEYFKWEITSGSSSNTTMQMSEFKLDMMTVFCKEHHLQTIEAKEPTCVDVGNVKYYQCTACELLFKDDQAKERYLDPSFLVPAKGHHWENLICTVCNSCAVNFSEADGNVTVTGFAEGTFIPNLVIPEKIYDMPVVAIRKNAFSSKTNLESVVLPATLKEIGMYAFSETGLTSVSIPASVETIDFSAFYKCYSLSSVTFAADACLKTIGFEAFGYCALTHVDIPASVEKIDDWAFRYCYYLSSVTFAENGSLTYIGGSAFLQDPLASIVIPASVEKIENRAFSENKTLRSVSFAANGNLRYIGNNAFYSTPLASINIPASVDSVESGAFANAKYLESITFNRAKGDDGIFEYFDPTAFDGDINLKTIYVPWKLKEDYLALLANQADKVKGFLTDDDGIVYEVNDGTHELACTGTSQEKMPNTFELKEMESMPVTEIRENAFKGMEWVQNIVIPASVKNVGTQAFAGCGNLKSVTIKGNETTIAANAFLDTPKLEKILVSSEAYADYKAQDFGQSDKLVAIYGPETSLQLTDDVGVTEEVVSIPSVYAPSTLSYQRQLETPGEYATICLPFAISLSEDLGMFEKVYVPLNTMIHNTQKSTPELEHFILMLEEQKPGAVIPAGLPIFVKMAEDKDEMAFTNNWGDDLLSTGMQPKSEEMKVVDWDGTSGLMKQNLQFRISYKGTFQPKDAQEADHLWTFNPDGTFGKQTDGIVRPFRLVLSVENESEADNSGSEGSGSEGSGSEGSGSEGSETESPATQAKQYVISIGVTDGTTTGIREIITSKAITASDNPNGSSAHAAGTIYDLSGRKVATTAAGSQDVKHLRKGIYVVNGKKIVVK